MAESGPKEKRKQRPPIPSVERLLQRDAKLWEREKRHAIRMRKRVMRCQCRKCFGTSSFKITTVERHLKRNGRDPNTRALVGQADRDSSDEEWAAFARRSCNADSHGLHMDGEDYPTGSGVHSHGDPCQGFRPIGYDFGAPKRGREGARTEARNAEVEQTELDTETRFQQMIFDMFQGIDEMPPHNSEEGVADHDSEDLFVNGAPNDGHATQPNFDPLAEFAEVLKPLYEGSKQSILEFTLLLVNLCTEHRVPQVFVNALLSLLKKKVLPQSNSCPSNWYFAKGLIKRLGLEYVNIEACVNGCVLFRKEHAALLICPKCDLPRYKGNSKIPVNRVRWFPLIPRLQRMYRTPSISQLLTWAPEHKSNAEVVHHVADSRQWKHIDELYPDFAKDPRNLRLALMLDGVNPFQIQSVKHSMWPIMLVNYNLPPWLATKRFFVMLSILISGTKSITQDNVDVYLQPLYEELQELWLPGIDAYDCHGRGGSHNFKLRAMVMWTINDYPALGYIAGLRTGGNRSCTVCGGAGQAERANCLGKSVHVNHRRWLPENHIWRTEAFADKFNGQPEPEAAPSRQSAAHIQAKGKEKQIFDDTTGRKKNDKSDPYILHGVHRRSALFDLPYWEHLPVRHCLDVMHLEKNVTESLLGFLLGTKDTKAVRDDLEVRGIRAELWAVTVPGRQAPQMPHAPYTFTEAERDTFMRRLKRIKAPDGYCGNWERKVELGAHGGQHKLFGLKSHDFHVLIQQILPMCIRGLLSTEVRQSVLALSSIFQRLCQKNCDPALYPKLMNDTIETLCRLEMTFPPAFFDVMTHLLIHAVEELDWCGPVHSRWMYFGERALAHFTRYSQTRANVGGSIAACYVREEALGYMTEYMSDMNAYGRRVWDEEEDLEVSGEVLKGKGTPVILTDTELNDMHNFVLQNSPILEPWRKKYEELQNLGLLQSGIAFQDWVQEEVRDHYTANPQADQDLLCLARPPLRKALSYKHMWAYGSHYRVKNDSEQPRATYDAGICGFFQAPLFAGSEETVEVQYVGELTHIFHLSYKTKEPVILFKGRWVRPHDPSKHPSVKQDSDGLLNVNFKQLLPEDQDPYVLPSAVQQVFFLDHESRQSGWRVVMVAVPRSKRIFEESQEGCAEATTNDHS